MWLENRMDREANINSIRALENGIKEHEKATAKLKRARNSLLNVSKLPPEVLGNIFRWNVSLRGDFGGLDRGSHNFLLVCHHWSEVASRTPELWSFWGNAPEDWARWYRRSGTAPLDLVLGGSGYIERHFDTTLREVLKDRATRDTIRRIHLTAGGTGLVKSILNTLTPNCDELRSNSIESFVLLNQSKAPVDFSKYFAHYRFPKLERITIYNCSISSWDHLTSRTSALTTLELDFTHPSPTSSPTPTVSQLLSIFSSNPALRKVCLLKRAVPDGDGGGDRESSSRVQLHHLKELRLDGGLRHVFNILHQLDHPRNIDLSLTLRDCDSADVTQIVGPYLRDHIGRRDRAQDGLSLSVSSGYRTYRAPHVALRLGKAGITNYSDQAQMQIGTFLAVTMLLNGSSRDIRERVVLDLVACTPREEIVYFKAQSNPVATEDTCTRFSNVKALSYDNVPLSAAFPNPNLAGEGKIFPSLEYVSLERMDEDDWAPLMTFLTGRVSSGNRLDILVIGDSPDMPRRVEERLQGMVRELKIDKTNPLLRLLDGNLDPF